MNDFLVGILLFLGLCFIVYSFISVALDMKKGAAHRKQVESYWDSMADVLRRIADKLEE